MDVKCDVRMWTGFVWIWVGPIVRLLWTRWWIFALRKRREVSRPADRL